MDCNFTQYIEYLVETGVGHNGPWPNPGNMQK